MTIAQDRVADDRDSGEGDMRSRIADLFAICEQVQAGPSEKATEARHAKGKLTARERIAQPRSLSPDR